LLLVGILAEIVAGSMEMGYGMICTTTHLFFKILSHIVYFSIGFSTLEYYSRVFDRGNSKRTFFCNAYLKTSGKKYVYNYLTLMILMSLITNYKSVIKDYFVENLREWVLN
jgi:hypothetical protein